MQTPTKTFKLAYFVSHPIQYQAPLLKQIADQKHIDLSVFFLCDMSTRKYQDTEFKTNIEWDIPLLEGYHHVFLPSEYLNTGFTFNNPKVDRHALKKVLIENSWDAVWIHGYFNQALVYLFVQCWLKKIPIFFRGESTLISSKPSMLKDIFLRFLVRNTTALLTVGRQNTDYYRHYGATEKQLFTMPYAVDNERFQSHRGAENSVKKPSNKKIVLFASKFIPRKHPLLLIDAFAQLNKDILNSTELWMIGDGPMMKSAQALVKKYELSRQARFFGFINQSQLPDYFASCDLFVLPSSQEPFGLVINEVMNLAKPVLTTSEVGAAADLVEHGVNGWVVAPKSKVALHAALTQALTESDLVEMGKQSLIKINHWSYREDIEGLNAALTAL